MDTSTSRRKFLQGAALASGAVLAPASSAKGTAAQPKRRPNILMICADQFRADFVGANGQNPSVRTPHIDALAERGTNFTKAVCNQPLCSPSRASFLTGMYATRTDVWKLGLELNHSLPTIATTLKSSGYETAFVGKWHVSATGEGARREASVPNPALGWVAPGPSRAGFDYWEGANVLEIVSHPTGGSYWDNEGKDIGFKDQYRVDFVCDRAIAYLQQKREKPWLLFVSQLEPHHQNDVDNFVGPQRYDGVYDNAFAPEDLRALPGNWNSRLPGYYSCVQAIDDCVGKLMKTLAETNQLENTVVVFFSDHGCHFRTRMGEYKRSPHDASIRVPLIFAGPGFDNATSLDEIVSLVDMTPTLIEAAGTPVPPSMQGRPLASLASAEKRKAWDNTAYIEISSSICGRAIRTRDWTYCAYDPSANPNRDARGTTYIDFALYHNGADPAQKLNLVGRPEYKAMAKELRTELEKRIVAAGEPPTKIAAQSYYA